MFFFIGMHTTTKDCGIEGYHTCTRSEMTKEEFNAAVQAAERREG